jgi:anaerobic magnesium-protoporphyrin IX monomethyl ester cyclase
MHLTFIFDDIILSHQPLGASYISSVLKEAGHKVTAINIDDSPDYVDRVKKLNPDVLAYSVATSQAPRYFEVNREIKREHNCLSLFGGPHPTFFPQMIDEEGVDAVCTGEGEYPTLEYLASLEEGKDFTEIPSMSFKVNGKTYKNANRPFIAKKPLNEVPFPDREIIRDFAVWKQRTGYIMAGRGCPYDCTFCFNHASRDSQEGRWTRQRSVDNVLAELHWLKETYKIVYVAFQDDTFILNRRWLRDFLPRYGKEIGLPFICNVRCDLTDEEEVQLLSEAGCIRVATGIENGNDELRRKILAKSMSTEQIIRACDLYNSVGIKVIGQNMFGVPGETVESALSTVSLNIRCKTHINTFSFFAPFPGTKLGEMCEQDYGFSGDLKELPREYQDGLAPSIKLENKELIEKIGQCAHLFVSYPRVFNVTLKFLRYSPSYKLKLMWMDWMVRMKRELIKKGNVGLPSVWHPPKFIIDAIHSEQPNIPIQQVMREFSREAA